MAAGFLFRFVRLQGRRAVACAGLECTAPRARERSLGPSARAPSRGFLAFLAIALALVTGCSTDDDYSGVQGLGQVLALLGRENLSFSVLTVNLHEVTTQYGQSTMAWQDRYGRIASWMASSEATPDLILLQEVDGRKTFGVSDYETLFTLITKIQEQTGVTYRIAYLSVRPVQMGLLTLWGGNAILYNPQRVTNRTTSLGQVTENFDDESVIGLHPRKSLPCTAPPSQSSHLCTLIDGDGVSWISSTRFDGRWWNGPAFSSFELKANPGPAIHIYNVHVQWAAGEDVKPANYLAQFDDLIQGMESRLGSGRLYPPITAGDFNLGEPDVLSHFLKFEIGAYVGRDVMGVLVGKDTAFPSNQRAYREFVVLPEDVLFDEAISFCGDPAVLWSDHCALFVGFGPLPPE